MNTGLIESTPDSRATWGDVYQRFRRMNYDESLIYKIESVERAWEQWLDLSGDDAGSFAQLQAELSFTVTQKAKKWERRFRRNGYTEEDFAAVMWVKIWTICRNYNQVDAEYLLFETIRVSLDRAVIDYLRKEHRLREREAQAWARWKTERAARNELHEDVESYAVNRLLVEQILSDPLLTDDERVLLTVMYENPDVSMREIGRKLGHENNAMKSKRMLERIKEKLQSVYGDVLES